MVNINSIIPISASNSISDTELTSLSAEGPIRTPVNRNPMTGGILNLDKIRIIMMASDNIKIMSFSKIMVKKVLHFKILFLFYFSVSAKIPLGPGITKVGYHFH
jgi:hypothetical protein